MSYDPKCYELAKFFLDDECIATEANINSLAQTIQDTLEDEISAFQQAAKDKKLADYDKYIDDKIDEWRETGIRPSVRPFRG